MLPLLTDDFGRIFLDSYQFTVTVLHEKVCNKSVHATEGSGQMTLYMITPLKDLVVGDLKFGSILKVIWLMWRAI
jgi:hypothetical protein